MKSRGIGEIMVPEAGLESTRKGRGRSRSSNGASCGLKTEVQGKRTGERPAN